MKTLAWDVDDVLNDLMREWFERSFLLAHPGCALRYEDIAENPPDRVLGISRAEYLRSLDAFRAAHQTTLSPTPEVIAWFEAHGDRARHIAVTATPLDNAHRSAAWVMRHFGRWIRVFALLPSSRNGSEPVYDVSKAEVIERIGGASALIDDSPGNLQKLARTGVEGILFPRPWNDSTQDVSALLSALSDR